MSTITIKNNENEIIASGSLGNGVWSLEGNFYFETNLVNLDLIKESTPDDTYTCPIKRSTCIYYNLVENDKITARQIAWNYKTIVNTTFKNIEGKIGFYSTTKNGLNVEIVN